MSTLPVILLAAAGVGFGHAVMPDHWLPLAILSRTRHHRTGKVVRLSLAAAVAHVVVSLLLGGVVIGVGLQFRATIAGHIDLVVGSILLATGAAYLILDLRGKNHGHGHGTHSHDPHHHHHHHHDHGGHGANDLRQGQGINLSSTPTTSPIGVDGVGDRALEVDGVGDRALEVDGVADRNHEHDHGHHEHAGHGGSGTAVLHRQATQTQTQTQTGARGLAALLVPFGAAASPDLTILPVFLAASALGAGAAAGSLAVFTIVTLVTIVGLTIATALGARLLTAPWIDRSANLFTAGTLLLIGALVVSGLI